MEWGAGGGCHQGTGLSWFPRARAFTPKQEKLQFYKTRNIHWGLFTQWANGFLQCPARSQYCGTAYEDVTCDASIPYCRAGLSVQARLLCFWSSSLLRCLGTQQKTVQLLGPLPPVCNTKIEFLTFTWPTMRLLSQFREGTSCLKMSTSPSLPVTLSFI